MKGSDGKYHIRGKTYKRLIGSRAEVMHGTAYKTSGNLTKEQLKYNKHHKIVSLAKSSKGAQMLKRLTRKGYFTRKGHFGYVKKDGKTARKHRRSRGRSRSRSRHQRRHYRRRRKRIKGVQWEDRMRSTGRVTTKPSYRRSHRRHRRRRR